MNQTLYKGAKKTIDVTPPWWARAWKRDGGLGFRDAAAHVIQSIPGDHPLFMDIVSVTVGIRGVQLLVAVPESMSDADLDALRLSMIQELLAAAPAYVASAQ